MELNEVLAEKLIEAETKIKELEAKLKRVNFWHTRLRTAIEIVLNEEDK